ncbi:Ger(x)C family spore germination C-terminal domain-containing protein [Paenibacillus sp. Mc5Re-14]|uniref:Ger(x)C family spore germination C-terminal domain-containing protein n=1 Tax=Paenibacillus sp. Mc5Re-14 TaxID=1030529 RepID=UPI0021002BD6|nr:Ger(x)C family spore germination C-terminal domain-containing protein [Paenibacillus sp. Mc5Re-14]
MPHVKGEALSFTVRIKTAVKLNENSVISSEFLKELFIRTAKETVQDEIKKIVLQSLSKLQKEMKADVAGFGSKVKVNYPAYWDRVKDNWQIHSVKYRSTFGLKYRLNEQVLIQKERERNAQHTFHETG